MKLGIYAFASQNGLAVQTKSYYDFLMPQKTMVIDISALNGQPVYPERYTDNPIGDVTIVKGYPQEPDIIKFLDGIDILLVAETPLNHQVFRLARERGVRTLLHGNIEFLDYFQENFSRWPKPDVIWLPTKGYYQGMKYVAHEWGCDLKHMPMPVDRSKLPFKLRTQAKKFLHIAGHKTTEDRNGTEIVRQAIKLVKNPDVEFIIRTQNPEVQGVADKRVTTIKEDVLDYWDIYADDCDVLLLPRRYGFLSLQKNEAMSLGMPVIMPNMSPNYYDLPFDCLIQPRLENIIPTRTPMGVYNITPRQLADRIDYLSTRDISDLSLKMNENADRISWDNMKPKYIQELERVSGK